MTARRAFIIFGVIAFLVYCWASVVYQNQVAVPGPRTVEIDLLGGKSRAVWDADTQGQFQRLMGLDGKNYQLPADAEAKDQDGNDIPPSRPLGSGDFAAFIARAPAGQPARMQLRDFSAVYGLLAHNYRLRDSIPQPGNPDGEPLYVGGAPLTKAMLDDLRARGIGTITVSGHGEPVGFLPGTAIMVAIIFLTLVAALKPVVWDPFLYMLERRRKELEIGAEAERQNVVEATRYADEERRRGGELDREIQELRLREQRTTTLEAGKIIGAAREREKAVKLAGLRQIGDEAAVARERMNAEIPELAEEIARALTPGKGRREDSGDSGISGT